MRMSPPAWSCCWRPLVLTLMLAVPAMGQSSDEDVQYLQYLRDNVLRGQLGESIRELDEFLNDEPDSVDAAILLARAYQKRGDLEDALELLEDSVEALPDTTRWVRWAATASDTYVEAGRIADAERALDLGLAQASDAALLSRKIELLVDSGRRTEAREFLARMPGVRIDAEGDPVVLTEHARANAALGLLDRADRCGVYAEKLFAIRRDPRQAEALRILGDVYRMGRSRSGLAALDAYRSALEIDATLAECHVGIARAYLYRMEFDAAEKAISAALQLRPQLPDALAVEAELLLFDRKFSEGIEVAEQGLAIHATHRALLACKAAGLVLLSAETKDAAIAAMLAADPAYADGFRLIGELVAHHYRFAESIPIYERGVALDPDWAPTYVGLARSLANTGQIDRALDALQEFRKRDPYEYPLANNLRESLGAVSLFLDVPRGHFHFWMDPLDSPVLGPLLGDLYEDAWADLAARYELDARDVRIEVFPKHDDFSARSVGFAGFGALGVCFGNTLTIISPRSELRGSFHYERTAVHELVHVVSLGLSRQRVPRWLTEGMSVYEERVFAAYCDREMDLDLFNYYHSGELVPVRDMNRLFGGPRILFGYYQGGLLCEYLVERSGHRALVDMLHRYAEDLETPEVVQQTLGITPEQLDQEFRDWLYRTRVSAMKVQPTYTEEGRRRLLGRVEATSSPDAALLTQVAWAYHRAGRKIDRDDFIARALELDPRHPPLVFLLGDVARTRDNPAQERTQLERGFELGGEEFFAAMRMAEFALQDRDRDAALEWYARAKSLFPRYVGSGNPYVMRARLLEEEGDEASMLEEWRQYCAIHEWDPVPRLVLVDRAHERGDFEEEEKYLLELRSVDPFRRQLHHDLARCQRELGKTSDAIESLQLALAVDPATEPDYDPAVPEEEREQRNREQRADILLDLGDLYLELGETALARRAIEDARQMDPGSSRLPELQDRLNRSP